ncbi:MAG: transposase [Acetobacteraceae bacterium]|nr:transposase [Acetobacteraceae bacterium]
MDSINTDAKGFRRVEVLSGPARRRRWSAAEKARIVAETLLPGASVSGVARRWQLSSQQVFTWRREARSGQLALPAEAVASGAPSFVPIVAEGAAETRGQEGVGAAAACTGRPAPHACIEIRLAGAVIRVARGTDCALLAEVLRALRASAA